MNQGKKYRDAAKKVEPAKVYGLLEAVGLLKEMAYAKFDETVELSMKTGLDPKKSDQNLRGTVLLPHGTGKKVRVLVFAKGEKEAEAREAGADFVGSDELIKKVSEGWVDFDVAVATPDIMSQVGRLGKILGVRGLMPNPKTGTVTFDVATAVKNAKAGQVRFRADRNGIIHGGVGSLKFDPRAVKENIEALLTDLVKAKPSSAKGIYVKKVTLSSTMGPGLVIDQSTLEF